VRASTLPDSVALDLVRLAKNEGVKSLSLDGSQYEASVRPLDPQAGETAPVLIVLRSHAVHLRLLRTLRAASVMAALLAVVGAVVLSYVVARTVTHPLATITGSMREMAATGDLSHKISLRPPWDDEDASLTKGTRSWRPPAPSRHGASCASIPSTCSWWTTACPS
jgi:methyl-accepting chemotaxis protein